MGAKLTIQAFADWCEKQPAGQGYNWDSPSACAVWQYADQLPREDLTASDFWRKATVIAMQEPRTFGDLATRHRRALSEDQR